MSGHWSVIAFQLSGDIKGCSVLDFGCGCGVTFKYFDAFNYDITASENQYYEIAQRVCDALDIEVKLYENLCDIKNRLILTSTEFDFKTNKLQGTNYAKRD